MELVKRTIKVGNSAGVLLPREYLNSQVKIILEPRNVAKDVIEILLEEKLLPETIGVYITGSYARGEQSVNSDIDVLVVTNKIERKITKEKYEILLVTKKTLDNQLKNNILPLLPMIKEAEAIINRKLLDSYKNTKLTKKNLRGYFEIVKSGLKVNKSAINVHIDMESDYVSDAIAYSLVLNLRSSYIVDCLIKNKIWSKKGLINLIKKITGSNKSYEGYQRVKTKKKLGEKLAVDEATLLYEYTLSNLNKQERWLKARRG